MSASESIPGLSSVGLLPECLQWLSWAEAEAGRQELNPSLHLGGRKPDTSHHGWPSRVCVGKKLESVADAGK